MYSFFSVGVSTGLRSMTFLLVSTALFLGIQFKSLHRWKKKELQGEPTWYKRWSTGHLFTLLAVLFIAHGFMLVLMDVIVLSRPDLIHVGGSYSGAEWGLLVAYTMLQIITTLKFNSIQVMPTDVADRELQEYFSQLPGSVIVESEKFQVLFDTTQLYLMLPHTVYEVFVHSVLTWFLYMLWLEYRNLRDDTREPLDPSI